MDNKSYSKGICWIDDCRIPFDESGCWKTPKKARTNLGIKLSKGNEVRNDASPFGRFPANLLVSDDMLNDGFISKSTGGIPNGKSVYGRNSFNESKTINTQKEVGFGDKGTNSRYYDIDKWFEKILSE